jgi:hypothetical protein
MMKRIVIALFIIVISKVWAFGQRQTFTNFNTWFAYIGTHKVNDKWAAFIDLQARRNDFLKNTQQNFARFGMLYFLNPNVSIGAGYGYFWTEPYGTSPAKAAFGENRYWEQIQWRTNYGKYELVNRLRLEQRNVNNPIADANGVFKEGPSVFTNRIRMQQKLSVPFRGSSIHDRSVYYTLANEMMVNFGENVKLNTFDQNRAFVGLGYRLPRVGRLEIGYQNQYLLKSDGKTVESNGSMNIWLLANFDWFKKKELPK